MRSRRTCCSARRKPVVPTGLGPFFRATQDSASPIRATPARTVDLATSWANFAAAPAGLEPRGFRHNATRAYSLGQPTHQSRKGGTEELSPAFQGWVGFGKIPESPGDGRPFSRQGVMLCSRILRTLENVTLIKSLPIELLAAITSLPSLRDSAPSFALPRTPPPQFAQPRREPGTPLRPGLASRPPLRGSNLAGLTITRPARVCVAQVVLVSRVTTARTLLRPSGTDRRIFVLTFRTLARRPRGSLSSRVDDSPRRICCLQPIPTCLFRVSRREPKNESRKCGTEELSPAFQGWVGVG